MVMTSGSVRVVPEGPRDRSRCRTSCRYRSSTRQKTWSRKSSRGMAGLRGPKWVVPFRLRPPCPSAETRTPLNQVDLIVIDPLPCYVPEATAGGDAAARRWLVPLAALAAAAHVRGAARPPPDQARLAAVDLPRAGQHRRRRGRALRVARRPPPGRPGPAGYGPLQEQPRPGRAVAGVPARGRRPGPSESSLVRGGGPFGRRVRAPLPSRSTSGPANGRSSGCGRNSPAVRAGRPSWYAAAAAVGIPERTLHRAKKDSGVQLGAGRQAPRYEASGSGPTRTRWQTISHSSGNQIATLPLTEVAMWSPEVPTSAADPAP